jgi:hypothetical protein
MWNCEIRFDSSTDKAEHWPTFTGSFSVFLRKWWPGQQFPCAVEHSKMAESIRLMNCKRECQEQTSSDSMSCGKPCAWDRCVKIHQIAAQLNILPTRMNEIVHNTSDCRKLAKHVPGKLCECHKQIMGLCLEHLTLYEPISGVFLNRTVTGYETWVRHFKVETKMYSTIENTWTPLQQRSL